MFEDRLNKASASGDSFGSYQGFTLVRSVGEVGWLSR
jgi:hypothetical protein